MSGNSTLSDSVSPNVGTQVTYDLKSWQGLTEVLKDGKNALRPDVYAEFRNLILQYAQHGGDVEYKKRVDGIIATFASGITETESSPKNDTISPLTDTLSEQSVKAETAVTSRRIQPRFDTPVITRAKQESEHRHEASRIQENTQIQVTSEPISIEQTESESEVIAQDSTEDEEYGNDLSEPSSRDISFLPKEIFEPEIVVIPSVAPVISSPEEYKKRIAEIKRTVNAHYENPVALMAAPGGLGKTYMNALLVALKAVGPGVTGDPAPALNQLEKAFDALLHIQTPKTTPESIAHVEEKSLVPEFSPKEIFPEPQKDLTPVVEDIPQKSSESLDETIAVNPDTEVIVPEVTAPAIPHVATTEEMREEDIPDTFSDTVSAEEVVEPFVDTAPKPVTRTEQILHAFEKTDSLISSVVSSVHKSLEDNLSIHEDDADGGDSGYTQSDKHVEQKSSSIQSETNQHVGTETKVFPHNKWTKKEIGKTTSVEKIKEKGFDTSKNEVKQAELYAPKTTAMLNNLLHEWSIFSASGFLGTGPSGAEHPLFVTLAPLSMGEVIAGRWEGVDPKQLKIIKQYVDAWRHEQGLTYTLSETFEHYLRRVVDRIAKRQNG